MEDVLQQAWRAAAELTDQIFGSKKIKAWTGLLMALLATVLVVTKVTSPKRLNLPPGPRAWPIVGSLFALGHAGCPPCRRFAALAERYGPVMFLWMGSVPTLVVSNAHMAMALLKTHDQKFASRPRLATGKHLGYNYSSVVFAPSGPHFRRMRKIYTSELLSSSKVELFHGLRKDEVRALLSCMAKRSRGEPDGTSVSTVNVTPLLLSANLNVLSRMIFGKRIFGEEKTALSAPEVEEFKMFVKEATKLVGTFNIGDYIPSLRWLDLQGVERTLRLLKPRQEGLLVPLIQQHRRRREAAAYASLDGVMKQDGQADFIASLVAGYSDISDETITAVAIDLLVGGSDSTSVAIEWALAELLRHPQILLKAQEELDLVVGRDRLVEESDIVKLPFFNCIMKESLRLHPPTPLGVPHSSTEACEIGGYHIPANTTAYINIWAIGRDPLVWENPTEFCPDRFIGSGVNVYGQDFHLLPFSSGRRGCPGVHLALASLKLTLANLLHCFSWAPPPPMKPEDIDMRERVGTVGARLTPLVVSVKVRLPLDVIQNS